MAYFVGHTAIARIRPFAIEEKATGACIGWCGPYYPEGWPDREIGYALASAARGKGYATEAARRALAYAYRDLRWSTAISFIALENSASIAVAERLGAKLESAQIYRGARFRRVPASAAGGIPERHDPLKGNNCMSLKIRLSRGGAKKHPFYRIVIADARAPRDGRFVEKIGTFDPVKAKDDATRLTLDVEKAKTWLAKGAQPTDRVLRLLDTSRPRQARAAQQSAEGAAAEEGAGTRRRRRRGRREGRSRLNCSRGR